jgi:hypothetical protein
VLQVLLDIFHGKSRVVKEISRTHPDRKSCLADLTTIFAKLHHYNAYPQISDLEKAFLDWMEKYQKVHAELCYNFNQKLQLMGKSIKYAPIFIYF